MKAIVVLNGEFYSGENTEENTLIFSPHRKQAVVVDDRRLRYIMQTVVGWSVNGVKELKRLEVLKVV